MFLGHFALGFAAKRITPRVSLAMLLLAAQWADAVWPVFVGLGWEQVQIVPGYTAFTPLKFVSYPYSHSLEALIIWGLLVGVAYRVIAGGRRTVWVLGALVVSHWLLDYLTHAPDMPLSIGGATYGLGLWRSIPLTIAVEAAMYAAGLWIYVRTTEASDAIGHWGLVGFAVLLTAAYAANVLSGPPPSVTALWTAAIPAMALLTTLAWWVDCHRRLRPVPRSA